MADIILTIPREKIRPFPGQPRKHFDKEKLRELADSISAVGQKVPVVVRRIADTTYELVDGERRWLACKIVGKKEMKAWVTDILSPGEQFLVSVVANFGREGHTHLEAARAIKQIKDEHGYTPEQIAQIFAHSHAWVRQHLRLLDLRPRVQALLEPDIPEEQRISVNAALMLSTVPEQIQMEVCDMLRTKKMTTNRLQFYVRRRARELHIVAGSTTRTPRDDFVVFQYFFKMLEERAERFLDMSDASFRSMFQHRSLAVRQHMIERVRVCMEQLGQVEAALMRAAL